MDQQIARSYFAAIRPGLDIRFGHDLDPFGGGFLATGRFCPRFAAAAQILPAPPRCPVVLNQGFGSDRPRHAP
jgi:hypothetical protein